MHNSKSTGKRIRLKTGVPSSTKRNAQEQLATRIIGQAGGVALAARAVARANSLLRDKKLPIFIAYLLGPNGVGKTSTVREVARLLHGRDDAFVKVNMADYKEEHRISQLIGAPAGYKGYKDASDPAVIEQKKRGIRDRSAKLSQESLDASRKGSKNKTTIVLFDEFDKSIEEFEDMLLSLFEGDLDMGNGEPVDYSNTIFFLSGNLGSRQIARLDRKLGFRTEQVTHSQVEAVVDAELKRRYKPEFLDRIDEICIYRALTKDELREVVNVEIEKLKFRLLTDIPLERQFELRVLPPAVDFILEKSLQNAKSARNIRKTVDRLLTDELDNELDKLQIPYQSLVEVTNELNENKLAFFVTEGAGKLPVRDPLQIVGGYAKDALAGQQLQERITRAHAEKHKPGKGEGLYSVTVRLGENELEGQELAYSLQHDLTQVFRLKIVHSTLHYEEPLYAEMWVRATPSFEELIKAKYPEAEIEPIDEDSVLKA